MGNVIAGRMTPQDAVTDVDRAFVWVEDYWCVDAAWESEPAEDVEAVAEETVPVVAPSVTP
mgnify:CR=1 FL=1